MIIHAIEGYGVRSTIKSGPHNTNFLYLFSNFKEAEKFSAVMHPDAKRSDPIRKPSPTTRTVEAFETYEEAMSAHNKRVVEAQLKHFSQAELRDIKRALEDYDV